MSTNGIARSRGSDNSQPLHFQIEASPSWTAVASWMLETGSPKNVVLTSANHSMIHSHQSTLPVLPESDHDDEELDYTFLKSILGAILLSTALACCSAFDADHWCRSIAAYDFYNQFVEEGEADVDYTDDVYRLQEQLVCKQMFRYVMMPVGLTILVGCLISWVLIRRHQKYIDQAKDRLARQHGKYVVCLQLAVISLVMVLLWVYGATAIMMRPRDEDVQTNQYRSLAAVDAMGLVGDNANLYYTTWLSIGLSISLLYRLIGDTAHQRQLCRKIQIDGGVHVGDVEAMLSSLTVFQLENYRESRNMWYKSLYRLRIRTGIWTAALFATVLVMASSVHIWQEVLIPEAIKLDSSAKLRGICTTLEDSDLPPTLCQRTSFSLFSGIVAAILTFGAIVVHVFARYGAARLVDHGLTSNEVCAPSLAIPSSPDSFGGAFLPLKSEFILGVILCSLLGLNAVCATAVNGPAANVGNLYYATWVSFLLCLRICLGCLEELCNIDEQVRMTPDSCNPTEKRLAKVNENAEADIFFSNTDLMDSERARRTRMYLFLGISSTVCAASALDAAMAQQTVLNVEQNYMIFAPSLVAAICACQFLLCLHRTTYRIVSKPWLGGILSVLTFWVLMVCLVFTMHSESSWAVNAIGEIQVANLYYFTWASIVTAGLLMMSYVKKILGLNAEDLVTVVWAAVCKVCFIILGGGYHVWHTIADVCTLDDAIRTGAVTYCSRTILAIVVAITGMLASGSISLTRFSFHKCCPTSMVRIRAHVQMVVAIFLVLLFGAALVLITGIGGPGQSVGDLFYGTWLAFLLSIGLVVTCYDQVLLMDTEVAGEAEGSSDAGKTDFVRMGQSS